MVSPSRSSTSRRWRDDAGKFFIGVLILLGLVASVFLVFSNSVQFARIGLVAALWAAVIGALAATRYRKEATIDKAKVRDLQTVYELQLELEVTARREYELGVESRVRQEVGADAAEMAALRAELTVLRESLQRLFDGDLPAERPALRADATRVHELMSSSSYSANDSSANANGEPFFAFQQTRSTVTPVFVPDHPASPLFADPSDEPVTAETAVVSLDPDEDPGSGAASADDLTAAEITDVEITDEWHYEPQPAPTGWADAFTEEPPVPPRLTPPEQVQPRLAPLEQTPPRPAAPESVPPPHQTPAPTVSSRRRRRVDHDTDSGNASRRLSVAEIMANLQSEQNGSTNR